MLHQISAIKNSQKLLILLMASVAAMCFMVVARPERAAAAACAPSGDRGVVTHTLTNVTAGTYRVWSRMMSAGNNNDSYFLEITRNSNNSKDCYVVGDRSQISSSSWTWVDYQNGNESTKINHNFPATGDYTIRLIGREDNVKLDRVMFLSTGCTPSGNGDNCAVLPNVAPTVSITSPSNNASLTTSPVSIQASASDSDGSIQRVEFQIDNGPVQTDYSSPYTYSWPISSANNGTRAIKATAYDNEGLASTTATINVTVNIPVADTTPPTVSLTAPTAGAQLTTSPVTLTATANDTSGIKRVEFYYDSTYIGASSNTSSPYSLSWNISSIPNGSYQIKAKAIDNSPNSNERETTPITVTINKPDVQDPTVPGNFRTTSVNPTSVALAWNASTDNVGVVAYELRRGTQVLSTNITGTTFTDDGVQPSSSYSYTVRARDAAGNTSNWTSGLSVNTPAAPDTTAPSVPTGVSATAVSPTQITVSWNASTDNVGVAKYRIYRSSNNTQVGEVNAPITSFGVTGLSHSTQYSYYVRALDAAGNISGNSSTASATTPAPADTTQPTVSITSPANNSTVNGTVNVNASASDNVGVTKVEFFVDGALAFTDEVPSPYRYVWNTNSVSNGPHSLIARAYDAAGNYRNSTTINVTVNNGSTPTTKPGDVNGDNTVGIADAITIAVNWGKTGMSRAQGDLNGDGTVGIADAITVAVNWGK